MTKTASHWCQTNIGQGFATYARLDGKWYSVNGVEPEVQEIRWEVRDPEQIKVLDAFVGIY